MGKNKNLAIITIIFVGICLRLTMAGVSPLLPYIQEEYHLSSGVSGLLTTILLVGFAVLSPFAGKIGQKMGEGRAISLGLILIIAGVMIRSAGPLFLYIGTGIMGAGIAIGNVLIPATIKMEFPDKVGFLTGALTISMGLGVTLVLALSVPIAQISLFGWRGSLLVWLVFVVVAWFLWKNFKDLRFESVETHEKRKSILKSSLAWNVTIFFGITSMCYYIVIAWLPTIFQTNGMDATTAGVVTSVFQLVGLPFNFLAPVIAQKAKDQRTILFFGNILNLAGVVLLIIGKSNLVMIIGAVLIGVANGANYSLAMALLGFRSKDAVDAARLSGFAQTVGYTLAATGPAVVGRIYDVIPNWSVCLIYLLIFSVIAIFAARKAGQNRVIGEENFENSDIRSPIIANQ